MAVKRADGRWMERFTYKGKRYATYGYTKKEAVENAERKKEGLIRQESGTVNIQQTMTLNEYHDRWEKARIGVVKEATIRKQSFEYKDAATVIIDEESGIMLGEKKLQDITAQDVRDLQRILQNTKNKTGSPKFTTNTINGIISHMKHIMNDALRERLITWNPFCAVKNLKRTEKKARDTIHRALTVEETQKFFANAEKSWYREVFKFMICSGCRCGEVGALRYEDVDFDKGIIHIRRTITKDITGGYVVGNDAKTFHGIRDIPLTPDLKEAIEQQEKLDKMLFGTEILKHDSLIFTSPEKTLLNDTSVNREIKRICIKAGIDRFTAHGFRDTFATRCIENGMKPKTLQEILGHSDISITMNLYVHVLEQTKVEEMELVRFNLG